MTAPAPCGWLAELHAPSALAFHGNSTAAPAGAKTCASFQHGPRSANTCEICKDVQYPGTRVARALPRPAGNRLSSKVSAIGSCGPGDPTWTFRFPPSTVRPSGTNRQRRRCNVRSFDPVRTRHALEVLCGAPTVTTAERETTTLGPRVASRPTPRRARLPSPTRTSTDGPYSGTAVTVF